MRMTIRPKQPSPMDLAGILDNYLKLKGVKKTVRDELGPTLAKLSTDRADLSRVQQNNIRACDLLHKYLEDIRMVGEAFEVGQAGGLEIDFVWRDSFSSTAETAQKCLALEEAAVLFNIASMLTALAADQGRNDEEGLKLSFNYFKQAAAVFSHITSSLSAQLLKPITSDLTVEGLSLCNSTCIAQAQECFYERAAKIKTSPKLLYKLAAGALFYYKKMVSSTKSPEVAKKLHGTWPLFAKLQMNYYDAECEFRYAQSLHPVPEEGAEEDPMAEVTIVAEQNLKIGEAISRLQKADAAHKQMLASLKAFGKFVTDPDLVMKSQVLGKGIERHLRILTSENNCVYFAPITPAASLPEPEMKVVVQEPPAAEVLAPFVSKQGVASGMAGLLETARSVGKEGEFVKGVSRGPGTVHPHSGPVFGKPKTGVMMMAPPPVAAAAPSPAPSYPAPVPAPASAYPPPVAAPAGGQGQAYAVASPAPSPAQPAGVDQLVAMGFAPAAAQSALAANNGDLAAAVHSLTQG